MNNQNRAVYLSNLTPLRGIAALLVAIFHFEMAAGRFVPAKTTMFFEKSYLMVDLFFVMSGFIIFHVYSTSFTLTIGKKEWRKFMVARFARIYPLHFFALTLLIILVVFVFPAGTYPNKMEFASAIPSNYLLLHSYYIHKIYTWNIPSWSISAEWAAYMVFPILALFINRKKKTAIVLLAVFTVASYLSIMYLLPRVNPIYPSIPVPHNINTTYDYGFLRGLAGFILGILVYLVYQTNSAKNIFQKDAAAILTSFLMIAALHFAINDGITVIVFALLVLSFACNNGFVHKLCNNRVAQYIGDISYSIYLMQIFLQEPFSKGLRLPGVVGFGRGKMNIEFGRGLMYCMLYLLLLIGISTITYYLIEQPCRKYINRKWGQA